MVLSPDVLLGEGMGTVNDIFPLFRDLTAHLELSHSRGQPCVNVPLH